MCIVQAWQYSYVVGELSVRFDANGDVTDCPGRPHLLIGEPLRRGATVVAGPDAQAMLADIAGEPSLRLTTPSAAASAVLAPFKAARDAFANTPAGRSADNLCLRRIPGTQRDPERSALGDVCNKDARVIAHGGDIQQVVAQAYLEHGQTFGGADIGLLNAGAIRIDIAAGDVTVGRVYTLLPFKSTLVRLSMTGAEVHAAVEDALAFVLGGPSNTGAYPYAAGLRFEVDLNRPRGARAANLQVKNAQGAWVPLDPNARYRLITINFLADGGDGFATLKTITGTRREDTYLDYADAFLQYVKARTPLTRLPVADYSTQRFTDTP